MKSNSIEKQLKSVKLPHVIVDSHKARLRRSLLNMESRSAKPNLYFNLEMMKKILFIGTPLFTFVIAALYILTIALTPSLISAEKVRAEVIKADEAKQQQGDFRYMKYAITTYFDGKSKDFLYEIVDAKNGNYRSTKEIDPTNGNILKSFVFDNRAQITESKDRVANCDLSIKKIMTSEKGLTDCYPKFFEQCDVANDPIACKIADAKTKNKSFINVNQRSNALCYLVNDKYFMIYGDTTDMKFISKHTTEKNGNGVKLEFSEDKNAALLIQNGYKEISADDYEKLCQSVEIRDPETDYQQMIKELKANPTEFGTNDGAVLRIEFRGNYYLQISPIISASFNVPKLIDAKKSTEFIDQYIQENGFRKVSIEDYVKGMYSNDPFFSIDPARPSDPNNQIEPQTLFKQLNTNKDVNYLNEKTIDGKQMYILSTKLDFKEGNVYAEAAFDKSTFNLYKVDEYKVLADGQKQIQLSYKVISLLYSNTEPVGETPAPNPTGLSYIKNGKTFSK